MTKKNLKFLPLSISEVDTTHSWFKGTGFSVAHLSSIFLAKTYLPETISFPVHFLEREKHIMSPNRMLLLIRQKQSWFIHVNEFNVYVWDFLTEIIQQKLFTPILTCAYKGFKNQRVATTRMPKKKITLTWVYILVVTLHAACYWTDYSLILRKALCTEKTELSQVWYNYCY